MQELFQGKMTVDYWKIIKRGAITFGSAVIGILSLYEGILAWIGDEVISFTQRLLSNRLLFLFLLALLITFITMFISSTKKFFVLKKNTNILSDRNKNMTDRLGMMEKEFDKFQEEYSDSICQLLEDAYDKGRYHEVIKIGTQLSSPLWYTGRYELRAKIGETIESAACQVGDKQTQAKVLIEMIGWTNIRIGNDDLGIQNISRGLKIAEEIKDSYLIASAYRNLADIHLARASAKHNMRYDNNTITVNAKTQEYEFGKSKEYIDNALNYAERIRDNTKKSELLGNIDYTYSKYYFEKKDYTEALNKVESAMEAYKKIKYEDKQIKLYNLKGEILLRIDERKFEAVNVFQEGLQKAIERNVNVHIVANALSLIEYFIESHQRMQAERMFKIVDDYTDVITDPLLINKIKTAKLRFSEGK